MRIQAAPTGLGPHLTSLRAPRYISQADLTSCSRYPGHARHLRTRLIRNYPSSSSSATSGGIPVVPLYIDGRPVVSSSAGRIVNHHAKTGERSCEVTVAGEEEVHTAIRSSRAAFDVWRGTNPYDRRKVLLKVLDLLSGRFDAFRTALLADGSVPATIDGSKVITSREPFGPVLSIPAFNFPLTLAIRSIVDPLACGNTVILKTSRFLPQLHALLHPLFADVGLPRGALQILHVSEEDVAARVEKMIAHPEVRMVNFTGSTKLGRHLASLCGRHLTPSVMELGGKSPAIVLEDADIKLAANNILFGALFNSGQVCMSTERVLVHESLMPALEQELLLQWSEVADKPFDVVRRGSVNEVSAMIDDAVKTGANRLTPVPSSSASPGISGASIVSNPSPSSAIWSTETFSPTLTLTSYTDPSDLISKLDSVPTGLSTSIFGSPDSAVALAQKIQSGSVHINGMTIHDEAALPFGGVRDSGWGRFNGRGAMESFTWIKNTRVVKDPHMLPLAAL